MLEFKVGKGLVLGALLVGGLAQFAQSQIPVPLARERIVTIGGQPKRLTSKLTKLRKVLVPEFFFGYNHNIGRPEVDRLLNVIAVTDSIQFTFVSDVNNFDAATFSQYSAIVFNNVSSINGSGLGSSKQNAIQSYVEGGGGVILLHATGDGKGSGWPWFNSTLHPTQFAGESQTGQTTRVYQPESDANWNKVLPASSTVHPIMESIPHDTLIAEEFPGYGGSIKDKVPSAEVLFNVDDNYAGFNCGSGCDKSNPWPHSLGWTFKIKKGTMVFAGFGHDAGAATTWGRPNPLDQRGPYYERLLRQSLYWAAGYDTTAATTGLLKGKAEDYRFRQYGVAFDDRKMSVLFTESGPHSVSLIDMRGHVWLTEHASTAKEHILDTSRLPFGVYMLRASTRKGVQSKRFVIGG